MYKVMLVDDEVSILTGLSQLIDWVSCGFEIISLAKSAKQALEDEIRLSPDLIITDIRMPGMSGLEMIAAFRRRGFQGLFMITSGYSDFEFAQAAIRHGVSAYLLKPIDERALVGELYAIRNALDGRDQLKRAAKDGYSDEKRMELFAYGLLPADEAEALLHQTRLGSTGGAVCVFQIIQRVDSEDMIHRFRAACVEFCRANGYIFLFLADKLCTVWIPGDGLSDPRPLYRFVQGMREELRIETRAAVGDAAQDGHALPASFVSARELLEREFLLGFKGVVQNAHPIRVGPAPDFDELCGRMLFSVECGSLSEINDLLEWWSEAMIASGTPEIEVKTRYVNLFVALSDRILKAHPLTPPGAFDRREFIEKSYLTKNIHELNAEMKKRLLAISDALAAGNSDQGLHKALVYIDRHYAEEITLDQIAQTFHYNTTYFGRKFRRFTGFAFNEYINNVRIEKAKRLLMEGYRIHRVAELVGYKSVDYFNQQFKKRVGAPPSEFRTGADR